MTQIEHLRMLQMFSKIHIMGMSWYLYILYISILLLVGTIFERRVAPSHCAFVHTLE